MSVFHKSPWQAAHVTLALALGVPLVLFIASQLALRKMRMDPALAGNVPRFQSVEQPVEHDIPATDPEVPDPFSPPKDAVARRPRPSEVQLATRDPDAFRMGEQRTETADAREGVPKPDWAADLLPPTPVVRPEVTLEPLPFDVAHQAARSHPHAELAAQLRAIESRFDQLLTQQRLRQSTDLSPDLLRRELLARDERLHSLEAQLLELRLQLVRASQPALAVSSPPPATPPAGPSTHQPAEPISSIPATPEPPSPQVPALDELEREDVDESPVLQTEPISLPLELPLPPTTIPAPLELPKLDALETEPIPLPQTSDARPLPQTPEIRRNIRIERVGTAGRFSLEANDVELVTLFSSLASELRLNIVTSRDLTGRVTLRLSDTSFEQLVAQLAAAHQLDISRSGDIWNVRPRGAPSAPAARSTTSRVISLRHISPDRFASAAKPFLTSYVGEVKPASSSSTESRVEIRDYPEVATRLEALATEIDVPTAQIELNTRVFRVRLEGPYQQGVRLTSGHAVKKVPLPCVQCGQVHHSLAVATRGTSTYGEFIESPGGVKYAFVKGDGHEVIAALSQHGGVEPLGLPAIRVNDGQTAVLAISSSDTTPLPRIGLRPQLDSQGLCHLKVEKVGVPGMTTDLKLPAATTAVVGGLRIQEADGQEYEIVMLVTPRVIAPGR